MNAIKTILITIWLVCGMLAGNAEYLPVLNEGKSWIVEGYEVRNDEFLGRFEAKVGETVDYNGTELTKVTTTLLDTPVADADFAMTWENRELWFHEDNGDLYYVYNPDRPQEIDLLFSLSIPKIEAMVEEGFVPSVIEIDIMGKSRIADYWGVPFGTDLLNIPRWVVEGIGCNISTVWNTTLPTHVGVSIPYFKVLECRQGDEELFTWEDFEKLPIPGTSTVEEINSTDDVDTETLFDIAGKPAKDPVRGTVYVQNGKKMILL